jgi:hypothetical protein
MAVSQTRFQEIMTALGEEGRLQRNGENSRERIENDTSLDRMYDELMQETDPERVQQAIQTLSSIPTLNNKGQEALGTLQLQREKQQKAAQQQEQIQNGIVDIGKSAVHVAMEKSGQLSPASPGLASTIVSGITGRS